MTRGRIGRYSRHKITIEQDSSAAGAEAADYTGTAFATGLPAEIDNVSGDETYRGRQLEAHCDWVVKIRRLAGVLPKMRVVPSSGIYTDQVMYVNFVQQRATEMGRLAETWLYCTEKPSE